MVGGGEAAPGRKQTFGFGPGLRRIDGNRPVESCMMKTDEEMI
jgi:hypothetical protein